MKNFLWVLLKETYLEWKEDKAPRLAAALAYYALFSMAKAALHRYMVLPVQSSSSLFGSIIQRKYFCLVQSLLRFTQTNMVRE